MDIVEGLRPALDKWMAGRTDRDYVLVRLPDGVAVRVRNGDQVKWVVVEGRWRVWKQRDSNTEAIERS